jgi:hypothetical protein
MRIRTAFFIFLICFCLIPGAKLAAQTEPRDPLVFDPGLRIWGADLGIGFRGVSIFPDLDTIFWLYIGGGYENIGYFLTPDGREYDGSQPGYDPETSPYYWRVSGRFDIGLAQGITWNNRIRANGWECFFFYRLRLDLQLHEENAADPQLVFKSSQADKDGLLQNSLFAGLTWNDISITDPHRVISGSYAEASVEWGPEFFVNDVYGKADFLRLNATARAFLPLWDLDPSAPANILSMYLGINFRIDYAVGNNIPLNILNSFGGREAFPALGHALRGYEDYRFAAPFKAVCNLELRTNLPAISRPDIIPGIVVFFDTGYYNLMDVDRDGLLFSTGAGLYLYVFDITSLCIYTQFPLSRELVTGGNWVPFALDLGFHF